WFSNRIRKIELYRSHVASHAHFPELFQQTLYVIRGHATRHMPHNCSPKGSNLPRQGIPRPTFVAPDEPPLAIAVACRGSSDCAASVADRQWVFMVLADRHVSFFMGNSW